MERNPRELLFLAQHMRGRMCYILLHGLNDPDLIVRRKEIDVSCDRLLIKMGKMNLLISIKPGVWKVNLPYLQKVSLVVPDEVFDHLADPEYMFKVKKEMGMYKKVDTYQEFLDGAHRRVRESKEVRTKARETIKKKVLTDDPFEVENILFVSPVKEDGDE